MKTIKIVEIQMKPMEIIEKLMKFIANLLKSIRNHRTSMKTAIQNSDFLSRNEKINGNRAPERFSYTFREGGWNPIFRRRYKKIMEIIQNLLKTIENHRKIDENHRQSVGNL